MLKASPEILYIKLLFIIVLETMLQGISGRENSSIWDDTLNTGWPEDCRLVEIRSTADGNMQKAWFYASATDEKAPLIVSLHTWSGDYNQEDPLAAEVMRRGWNYIHPDFRGPNNTPDAGGSDLVISDIRDAIEFALRHSASDPEDVHIIGVSGGGYATLAAYMKLDYPVRSFNAWAAISDLEAWYSECRSRGLRYASDIKKITTGGNGFDSVEARRRSPLFMQYSSEWRKGATLNLFAGITDGYTGSVPIIHSTSFYNRIINLKYPEEKGLAVPDTLVINLLARRYDTEGDYPEHIGGRNIYLSAGTKDVRLVIFYGWS
jgi:pimeloyl-ACP methyl ester carboxylesterase